MKNNVRTLKGSNDFVTEQDKLIGKVLKESEAQNFEYLSSQEELNEPHTFSPEFEAKMEQLFQSNDLQVKLAEKEKRRFSIRFRKGFAIAACAVVAAVVVVGIQTEAIPFPKFSYKIKKDEGSYTYLVEQEKYVNDMLEEKYDMTTVPKGYQLQETSESSLMYYKKYVNKKGEKCIYRQLAQDIIIRADEILKDYDEMIFGESKYYFMDRDNFSQILWYADEYQYCIQADLSVNELVELAQSVEKQ